MVNDPGCACLGAQHRSRKLEFRYTKVLASWRDPLPLKTTTLDHTSPLMSTQVNMQFSRLSSGCFAKVWPHCHPRRSVSSVKPPFGCAAVAT